MPQTIIVSVLNPGGSQSKLGQTAAVVVKNAPGTLFRVFVNVVGTAGNLTFNDTTTTGAAASGNQICSIPFGDLAVGQEIELLWPCKVGIVMSAIPTGGNVSISYS
jgi:hypothetical protein